MRLVWPLKGGAEHFSNPTRLFQILRENNWAFCGGRGGPRGWDRTKRIKRLLAPRRLAPPDLRVCVCVPARVCRGLLFMTPDWGGGRLRGTKTRVSIAFCEAFVTTKCSSLAPPSSPLFAPWGPPETPRPALRAGVGGGGRAKPTHSPARPGAQAQLWLSQLRKVSPHCLLCCCLVS